MSFCLADPGEPFPLDLAINRSFLVLIVFFNNPRSIPFPGPDVEFNTLAGTADKVKMVL